VTTESACKGTREQAAADDLPALVASEIPAAIALRHRLHADPRLSGDEHDTAEAVCTAIGLPGERVAKTGRMLRIGPPTGPAIALRAELDALPLLERSNVTWASRKPAMHACGHDVHCAALIAVARAARHASLPVGLVVLLQPREEQAPSGALDILADPAFLAERPTAVVGVHVQPQLPRGHVGLSAGPVNAACDIVEITVTGRGGHGAYPHRTDDPVLAMAQIVTGLHHLVSRRIDPLRSAVVTVGEVHAGTAPNIIPETAWASVSVRTLDSADRRPLHEAICATAAAIATGYGCRADIAITELDPTLDNHPGLVTAIRPELTALGATPTAFRSCGSDDFAFYTAAMPAVMLFVGTNDGDPGRPGLHHPQFVPPDDIVSDVAISYLAALRGAMAAIERG
jgi:amidohydrolase